MQADEQDEEEDEGEEEKPVWIPFVAGPFTKEDAICVDLRRLQHRSKCSDSTCADALKTFAKYLGFAPTNIKQCDRKLKKAAGAKMIRLDGCVGCNKYVYRPGEEKLSYCPRVKSDGTLCLHPRFDQHGQPHEVRASCSLKLCCVMD